MLFLFLFLKLVLTLLAVWLIIIKSYFLLPVFVFFIAVDMVDGKIMKNGYRAFDTLGDRVFAYGNFLTFLIVSSQIYPAIIYIGSFLVRDLVLLTTLLKKNNFKVESNFFDRMSIVGVATFFALQASGTIPETGMFIEITSYFIAFIIFLQGFKKIKRIK